MNSKNRIAHYDILRGVAISLMIMANSVAAVYDGVPPLLMRLAGSFAAPSFMILAGMMLALASKPRPLRGLNVIAVAALIDLLLWKIVPFLTFDVLYSIGFAIVVTAYPARHLPLKYLWGFGLLFLLIGQALQLAMGYNQQLLDIFLTPTEPPPPVGVILTKAVHQMFVDGWFPVFPWLGFVWLGAALQRSLQVHSVQAGHMLLPRRWVLAAVVVFALAASYWTAIFELPEIREGYSELFYPANLGFCFTALSMFVMVLYLVQTFTRWQIIRIACLPLTWLGQRSMSIYVFHMAVADYIIKPFFGTDDLHQFLQSALMLWIGCVLFARLLIACQPMSFRKPAWLAHRAKAEVKPVDH